MPPRLGAMIPDRPSRPGSGVVRTGGYVLEPGLETGTRIVLVERPPPSSGEIRAALAEPERQAGAGRGNQRNSCQIRTPRRPAFEEAERVTAWLERVLPRVVAVLSGNPLDRSLLEPEARAGIELFERLDRRHRFKGVLRVGKVLAALLLLTLRWVDLVRVLRTALRAARELGDEAAEAWAQHDLGTFALAGGDVQQAARATRACARNAPPARR